MRLHEEHLGTDAKEKTVAVQVRKSFVNCWNRENRRLGSEVCRARNE